MSKSNFNAPFATNPQYSGTDPGKRIGKSNDFNDWNYYQDAVFSFRGIGGNVYEYSPGSPINPNAPLTLLQGHESGVMFNPNVKKALTATFVNGFPEYFPSLVPDVGANRQALRRGKQLRSKSRNPIHAAMPKI
ncbi:MAG TPA: hypothetical protein VFC07_00980 [Verrucomicrobiae bacterium]|nr:hypothetical protein [Verrucomicrobiae bacterium]